MPRAARHVHPCRAVLMGVVFAGSLAACTTGSDDAAGDDDAAGVDETTGVGDGSDQADGSTGDPAIPAPTISATEGTPLVLSAESVDTNVLAARLFIDSIDDVAIDVVATSDDHVVQMPRTAGAATAHELPLVGLRADRTYDVVAVATGANGAEVATATTSVTTGELPDFLADHEIVTSTSAAQPGLTMIEVVVGGSDAGYAVAVDGDGEVVWYLETAATLAALSITPDGTFLGASYPSAFAEVDVLGTTLDEWQLAPPGGWGLDGPEAVIGTSETDVITLDIPWDAGTSMSDAIVAAPHHDIEVMPNGNLLGLARLDVEVTDEFRRSVCPDDDTEWAATSDVVVEFEPDGTVVRTWNVADAVAVDEQPGVHLCVDTGLFASVEARDWSHANAAVYDAERDVVLVSARHLDSVIAFEHGDEEGRQTDVAWILGANGTLEIDGEPFLHQHAPEVLADGSILVYDNGNERDGGSYSRAVEYAMPDDPSVDGGTATQVWEHRLDDIDGSPLYAEFLGDVDRLDNGNVLITHGGIGGPNGENRVQIIEVVPDRGDAADSGEIVFDIRFGTDDLAVTAYRSERIDSLYAGPSWEPIVG